MKCMHCATLSQRSTDWSFVEYFLVLYLMTCFFFFFSSRRRHTRCLSDWSSDVCSSDLDIEGDAGSIAERGQFRNIRAAARRAAARRGRRPQRDLPPRDPGHAAGEVGDEIGRASCRERVEVGEVGVAWREQAESERSSGQ